MINREEHPVGWSLLLCDLSDAQQHIRALLKEMAENPEFSEVELRIWLGTV